MGWAARANPTTKLEPRTLALMRIGRKVKTVDDLNRALAAVPVSQRGVLLTALKPYLRLSV